MKVFFLGFDGQVIEAETYTDKEYKPTIIERILRWIKKVNNNG